MNGGNTLMSVGTWTSVFLLIGLLGLVLFVAALVSIARTPQSSSLGQPLWILIVLAFPVIGPVLWFLVGKGTASGGTLQRPES